MRNRKVVVAIVTLVLVLACFGAIALLETLFPVHAGLTSQHSAFELVGSPPVSITKDDVAENGLDHVVFLAVSENAGDFRFNVKLSVALVASESEQSNSSESDVWLSVQAGKLSVDNDWVPRGSGEWPSFRRESDTRIVAYYPQRVGQTRTWARYDIQLGK